MSGRSHTARNTAAARAAARRRDGRRGPLSAACTPAPRAAGAWHAFGDLRVTAGRHAALVVGQAGRCLRIEAERAADRALAAVPAPGGASSLAPQDRGSVQRRANPRARRPRRRAS